jgi:hypothetical protein
MFSDVCRQDQPTTRLNAPLKMRVTARVDDNAIPIAHPARGSRWGSPKLSRRRAVARPETALAATLTKRTLAGVDNHSINTGSLVLLSPQPFARQLSVLTRFYSHSHTTARLTMSRALDNKKTAGIASTSTIAPLVHTTVEELGAATAEFAAHPDAGDLQELRVKYGMLLSFFSMLRVHAGRRTTGGVVCQCRRSFSYLFANLVPE